VKGIGQAAVTTTTRGAKGKAPEAPTGVTTGLPPPPSPHSRPASPRLCCSDRAGSDEIAVGKGPIRLGGLGPPDTLEGLKALYLCRLEEWWREIAYKDAMSPATEAAVKTVPPRLWLARGTSRSTVETSSDETEGLVAVARGRSGERGERAECQKRNLFLRSTRRWGT
jgi:hypothetical protein